MRAVLFLTTCVLVARCQTCPAGEVCLEQVPVPAPEESAAAPAGPRQERLAALNEEISLLSKVIAETNTKLKLLERKRRLLFPKEHIYDVPPEDDFAPSALPLLKDIHLQSPPAKLQALFMATSPLIAPPKGAHPAEKIRGACVIAVGGAELLFYNALGQLLKTEPLELAAENKAVAIAAASDGKGGMIAVGTQNGTVLMLKFGQKKSAIKMDFYVQALESTQSEDPELRQALGAAVTAVTVQKHKKTAITYVGDAEGRIRVYSTAGKLMRLIATSNLTEPQPGFMPAAPVSALHCCVDKNLVVSVGNAVGLLDTSDLSLRLCHKTEHPVSGVSSGTPPLSVVHVTTNNQLHTLRSPRKLRGKSLNSTVCVPMYTSQIQATGVARVYGLKNYVLVHSAGSQNLVVYNATKLKTRAPWPVFDVEVNTSGNQELLVSTDAQGSFTVGELGAGKTVLYHAELPQLTIPSSWDLPSRPVAIALALVMVFGYKYFSRGRKNDKEDSDMHNTGGWNRAARNKHSNYNSMANKYGQGKFRGKDMQDMVDMEKRIDQLSRSTNQLGELVGSVGKGAKRYS